MAFLALWLGVFITVFVSSAADTQRIVTKTLYPDCDDYPSCIEQRDQNATALNASFQNVAYIKAADGNDVLHFVMSTIHLPSILVVHTDSDPKATVKFDWDGLLQVKNQTDNKTDPFAGAISVNANVKYSYALVFTRLIEYDDAGDASDLSSIPQNKDVWNTRNFTEFEWMKVTLGQSGKSVIFNTSRPQLQPFENNTKGSMYFEFEINTDSGRDSDLPRLIFNTNNTQLNFALDGYIPMYNKSRFALEMSIVANYTGDMAVKQTKSIDDEYSPGVFKVETWYTGTEDQTGYVQWKPVCYLDPNRARAVGTEVKSYDLQQPSKVQHLDDLMENSLASAFYGNGFMSTSSKTTEYMAMNVSFGLSQDGFYNKNNYTVWTASIGYGVAPVETISTLVIIIIAAGLGIPVVIILFGGIYVCVRRSKRTVGGYERIDDAGVN